MPAMKASWLLRKAAADILGRGSPCDVLGECASVVVLPAALPVQAFSSSG